MDWKERMNAPMRDLRLGGRIVFGSGMERALSGDCVCALTIDEGANGSLVPGSVLCAECVLDLVNDRGQWTPGGEALGQNEWIGATLMPQLGLAVEGNVSWKPLGVFIVESAVCMDAEGILRVRACDSIGSELGAVFKDGLNYPRSLEEIWRHALEQTRYAWAGEIPNGKAVINAAPDWKDASVREVLGHVAAAAGCFVRIGRSGGLELCRMWDGSEQAYELDEQNCTELEWDGESYGPVDALRIKPVGEDGEERLYLAEDSAGLYALRIENNPLFRAEAAGLDDLARGTLEAIAGFSTRELGIRWRGDPELKIGGRIIVWDSGGRSFEGVVTRQTLRCGEGFSAELSCGAPRENNSGVRRAITPEGGLNAAALTGAVDGRLLRVGSVSTAKLAAGSVTAEKLAAGAVDAGALSAVIAKIESLDAGDIETDRLAAALAAFTVMTAGTADFDRATVAHLVAQAMNLEFGAAEQVFIRNLAVEYAQMVGAAIGNLCIRASDGNYYQLDVGADGSVTATLNTSITGAEIAAGQTTGGQVILETDITAANLNTSNLLASYALVNRIDAARIDVDQLFAREAFIALLRTSRIVGEKSIAMIAEEAQRTAKAFRQEEPPEGKQGVRVNDLWIVPGSEKMYQATDAGLDPEFFLDDAGELYYALAEEAGADASMVIEEGVLCSRGFGIGLEDGRPIGDYCWVHVLDKDISSRVSQLQHVVRIEADGLHVGAEGTSGEVLIDSDSVDVRLGGQVFSSFGGNYVEFGNYQMRRTMDGGLAFKMRR